MPPITDNQINMHANVHTKIEEVKMNKIVLVVFLLLTPNVYAQKCESVIALSKTTSNQVADKDTVEQQAASFCNEYKKSVTSGSAMDAGGSYGIFSASVGMSNQSAEAIATRYCSASNSYAARRDAFKSYVESISPDAYTAYEACLRLSNSNLAFGVDAAGILPNEFSISASFRSTAAAQNETSLEVSASDGVTCQSGGQTVTVVPIKTGSTVVISCKRSDRTQRSYVRFVNRGSSNNEPLTLPWQGYDAQGNPVDSLFALQKRLEALEGKIEGSLSLSGVVSLRAVATRPLMDSSICPTGTDAYRGEMNGRVNFAKAFAAPPVVNIGIASIDISPPANGQRLTVAVTSIDRAGFNYSFHTWCTTAIAGATASWIAVSR